MSKSKKTKEKSTVRVKPKASSRRVKASKLTPRTLEKESEEVSEEEVEGKEEFERENP